MLKFLTTICALLAALAAGAAHATTFSGGGGPVPDNACRSFAITVSGMPTPARLYEVGFTIDHVMVQDLDIELHAPNGVGIVLTRDNGGSGDNYMATRFRRDATTPITAGIPPFNGIYLPVGSFTTLDGSDDVNGTWTLRVCDDEFQDDGLVRNWYIVVHASQTITFGPQPAQNFSAGGAFSINPLATASSGLTPLYGTETPAVCTVSGTTVTMVSAGLCTLTADQAGNDDYLAAPRQTQSFTINPGPQTITFPAQPTRVFAPGGTFPVNPPATASSGLPVSYSVTTPAICSLAGTTVTMIATGTCTIAANQAGNVNFLAAPTVTQSVPLGALVSRTEIRSSANPAAFGAPVIFTATVTGAVVPGGTVQFFDASDLLCDAVPVSGSEATCQTSNLSEGGHAVRAVYAGDVTLASSSSDELVQIVPRVGVHHGAWWGGPAENGWGLSIMEQGNTLVAGWYFFDAGGNPTWLIMPGCTWNPNRTACSGNLQRSTASWFGNYRADNLVSRIVGTASFTFSSADAGRFDFTVDGVSGSKVISRLPLGLMDDPFDPTNIWSGGTEENGWGVSLFSAGDALVGVWYTYDRQGNPTWLLFNNGRSLNPAAYVSQLIRASGSPMIGTSYDPNRLQQTQVGEIYFQFLDRNRSVAGMGYLVEGLNQGKVIRKSRF